MGELGFYKIKQGAFADTSESLCETGGPHILLSDRLHLTAPQTWKHSFLVFEALFVPSTLSLFCFVSPCLFRLIVDPFLTLLIFQTHVSEVAGCLRRILTE